MANRLANETSPYLLQHKDNPVDWYPWGEEALKKARDEDRPILLSVGYSACHWCHVMERESFEDEATAQVMNAHFVSIKVDREERPDIDSIYMAAVQALTRGGGWPMTVFLTPDGSPFYGGTYFPPVPSRGMPSFTQLLTSLADAYENRREDVLQSAKSVREYLQAATGASMPESETSSGAEILDRAAESLLSQVDRRFGGFGGAPKFPQTMNLEVLLRYHHRAGDRSAIDGVQLTLRQMANGGIYDQLGGGFARYSVDERWLVPHFEKMLYDNALLARLYLETYQATGDPFYRRIAEETLDYVLRDMTSPEGGFYAAEDADSEGVEGKFYVWTPEEIEAALEPEAAKLAMRYWDVTEQGNFEGKNILNVPRPPEAAAEFGISGEELWERIVEIRARLLAGRDKRVRPGRDEKILAAWNGLMLRSFALAARVTGREDYREAARGNAAFLLEKLRTGGRLRRSYKDGRARFNGYLEDYAMVADGLVALYEATFETRWLAEADDLCGAISELFWDGERRTFYDTPIDHEQLVTRPRDVYDNAAPSGVSVAVEVLLKLALLLDRNDYRQRAEGVLEDMRGGMEKIPGAFGRLLCALDFNVSRPREIALVGDPDAPDIQALIDTVYARYLPNKVVTGRASGEEEAAGFIPLLADRPTRDGKATAYVCEGYVCKSPTTDAEELAVQLAG